MGPDIATQALVDEAMRKSALIWLEWPGLPVGRAVWHVWLEGRAYVLTRLTSSMAQPDGDREQPDPGFAGGDVVLVVVRSKDNEARLVTFDAEVTLVVPADGDWQAATAALAAGRLNLRNAEDAPRRWAADDGVRIYRLTPDGTVHERPGDCAASSLRAAPVATPATTAGPPPRVFHRRGGTGRPLS
ncbi:MAG: hypothetical protein ACR2GB_07290 [Nocardioidaceae bacterium]